MRRVLCVLLLPFALLAVRAGEPPTRTALRFEVSVAKGLLDAPTDGRVFVVLATDEKTEPRAFIGETGLRVPPVLAADADRLASGGTVALDQTSAIFPIYHLASLPKGTYRVQAVFDHNRDLRLVDAPGNLVSEPVQVTLDPAAGGTVKLDLTRRLTEAWPRDTETLKFIKLRSEKLSKFHGRDIYLRAGVILPPDHAKDRDRAYPLRVHISGFGGRYNRIEGWMHRFAEYRRAWGAPGAPRMIVLHLDGAGPLGDPYQVNSANHGPYGDAVTQELIPYVEKTYRGVGKPWARVLDGASTGGWVSLALQVFYPDFFTGAWSHCPDPVDFRAFELIDVYRDENAYVNRAGFERPAAREVTGDTRFTVRHEVHREVVLGRGNRWTLSGKDWASWNATFSARGDDGLPVPLWDGRTGKIDRKAAEHWQKYDLRLHVEKNRAVLAPKLRGKLRIWVGEADDYFLNNAVHLLDGFFKKARPSFEAKVTFAPGQDHNWRGLSERQMIDEMAAAVEAGRKAAGS
jgi:hypothetical protein